MKSIYLFPLAYLVDVHGFVFFAPYMLVVLIVAWILAGARRRAAKMAAANADVPGGNEGILSGVGA